MNKFLGAVVIMLMMVCTTKAQAEFTISGYVKDGSSGEELIGATVSVAGTNIGTITNVYGFYSLTLEEGTYEIQYNYLGFDMVVEEVDLTYNQSIDIEMGEGAEMLSEIVVTDKKENANVTDVEMSTNKLDIETIKKIPALLGEVDIISSIKLLPGVSTIGEGASGFNVRGGNVDQNLVLLDEAPVFNQSHLFGFFSVFNPDAVKNVKLIKGGIPAQYGGRLSSILDIRMLEGNQKEFEGSGGVGLIFSRLAFEAPIVKDEASFLVAARRSYVDVLAKPFLNGDLKDSKFYFYDLTAKVNWKVNGRNRLFLSGSFGRDVFDAGFGFDWGNTTGTLRWNSIFNDKLFMNASLIFSDYDYSLGVNNEDGEGFKWNSSVLNYIFKNDYNYYLNNRNTITAGYQGTYYVFKPGTGDFNSAGEANTFSLEDKQSFEFAAFVQNEQKVGDKLTLQYGLRYSNYAYLGATTVYEFDPNSPVGESQILTNAYLAEKGEAISTYGNLEPRFGLNYVINKENSIKFSYNRMAQYINLTSNTAATSPLDIWSPVTNNIKPQIADQFALGYFKNFKDNKYEASVEVYYKPMQNQIEYVNGARIFFNDLVEGDMMQGDGRAYGAEFFIKKNTGRFTGWISYTLSRTELKMDAINNGDWYVAKYDKTHNLKLVGMYEINDKWDASATFTFTTGGPATFPTGYFQIGEEIYPLTSGRNQQRLPNYHRLDLSATYKGKPQGDRAWDGEWVFGVYNAYNRRNAFNIYFQEDENAATNQQAIRVAILGSVVPSVSYNFKF